MNIRIYLTAAVLFCGVACAGGQHAGPVVAENEAQNSPGRELRYVPSQMELAVWRKPTGYTAWDIGSHRLVEFSDAGGNSGTTHPMAVVGEFEYGGRKIAIAVDAKDPDATSGEGVRVDMSGKGDFRGAELLPFGPGGGVQHEYGSAVVPLELDGTTVPFMVWGRYDRWSGGRVIQFDGYLAAEGLVEIAGKDYPVRLIDSSKNWKLGDKPQPRWDLDPYFSGDSLAVDTGEGNFEDRKTVLKVWYGQPVEIDGRLYDIHLTDDGKELRARALPADEVGVVRVAGAKSFWGILMNKDRVLNVSSGDGPDALVPAGEYVVKRLGVTLPGGGGGAVPPKHLPETIVVSPECATEIETGVRARPKPEEAPPADDSEVNAVTLD